LIDLRGDPEFEDRVVEFVLRDVFVAAIQMLASKRLVARRAPTRGDARHKRCHRQPSRIRW
jgi:hypothetical protein